MELKNLTTFLHVAELGSFSRAGERLGYSQPTVSVQIRQLEQELGFRLFDRIGHAVRLTDKGRDALFYAQKVCRLCQQMSMETPEDAHKEALIRLATSDSLSARLLLDCFPRIRQLYPGIHLNLTTAGTGELFRLLDHNEVDLVCTLDSHIYNTNYVIATEERVGLHFVVSSADPLAHAGALEVRQLLDHPFLLTEKGMSYRRLLDENLARNSMEIQPIVEIGRADLICNLVAQDMCISFLPDYVTEAAVKSQQIVRLEVPDFNIDLWKQLLYHRDKWMSRQLKAVMTHLEQIVLTV